MKLNLQNKKENQYLFKGNLPLFLEFCEEISTLVEKQGIEIEPHNSIGIDKFISTDITQQLEILTSLKSFLHHLNAASLDRIDLRNDNRVHAWSSLISLGFVPSEDLFDKIDPKDIIEIYDVSSIQLFRSFELFNHISYTFSELFSFTWMDLFERDSFVGHRMLEASNLVLSGKTNGAYYPNMPSHVVSEKFSASKHWIEMNHRLMSPLYRADGSLCGFLNAFEIVNSGSNRYLN